jgi:hypothetical protein
LGGIANVLSVAKVRTHPFQGSLRIETRPGAKPDWISSASQLQYQLRGLRYYRFCILFRVASSCPGVGVLLLKRPVSMSLWHGEANHAFQALKSGRGIAHPWMRKERNTASLVFRQSSRSNSVATHSLFRVLFHVCRIAALLAAFRSLTCH